MTLRGVYGVSGAGGPIQWRARRLMGRAHAILLNMYPISEGGMYLRHSATTDIRATMMCGATRHFHTPIPLIVLIWPILLICYCSGFDN